MNTLASSVASTWKPRSSPSERIAAMPAGIESWRNPVVLENTSARNDASGSSGPSTVTVTDLVASASPSLTVTFAV